MCVCVFVRVCVGVCVCVCVCLFCGNLVIRMRDEAVSMSRYRVSPSLASPDLGKVKTTLA